MYGAGPERGGDRQFGNQMFRGDGILDSQVRFEGLRVSWEAASA
jgi:hypothetical protein